jgi:hypothetical protein
MEIYVATHKRFEMPSGDAIYRVVQGGCALYPLESEQYQRDDTGDNLSAKRDSYSELTVFYWAWKNSKAAIKGLCHYRRFFCKGEQILSRETAERLMEDCEAILPYPMVHVRTSNYREILNGPVQKRDMDAVRAAVQAVSPEYLDAYDQVMQRHFACYRNMLVAKSEVYDAYAAWLFSVMDELEKHLDLEGYTGQERRFYGFVGELLLNVWFHKNRVRVNYCKIRTIGAAEPALPVLPAFKEKLKETAAVLLTELYLAHRRGL